MSKVKVSDYIANFLADSGLTQVFMVTGGGAMHLNHSLGSEPRLNCIFNHHEQACEMAADAYARISGKPAIVNVTTGPGGINALNGVFGAYTDSIPMIVVAGQVRYDTTVHSTELPLRQLGDQEYDIIPSVKPMTKYAVMVTDPLQIRAELKKCVKIASAGRPGPVWIDIPMNVQGSYINTEELYDISEDSIETDEAPSVEDQVLLEVISKLQQSERPVLFAGAGVRISGMHQHFLELIEKLKIPVVAGWNAYDSVSDDNEYYAGRPGTVGDRAGNFAVQNADLLLILGSRLNIRQIGYNWQAFSRESYKIMFDADIGEMKKPTIQIDMPIHCQLQQAIPRLAQLVQEWDSKRFTPWVQYCRDKVKRYPVLQEKHTSSEKVNPYYFVKELTSRLPEGQVTVTGDGSACVIPFQVGQIKKAQRIFTNSGSASMGFDLPAAIGASAAIDNRQTVMCFAGDGSVMMNLQELQTIRSNNLNVKIVVFNNEGYLSIKQTHDNFFNGRLVGCNADSGVSFPDFKKVAEAFDFSYMNLSSHEGMGAILDEFMDHKGAIVLEVNLDPAQPFEPKSSSMRLEDGSMVSRPLEDLAPFLDRVELEKNMIIKMI